MHGGFRERRPFAEPVRGHGRLRHPSIAKKPPRGIARPLQRRDLPVELPLVDGRQNPADLRPTDRVFELACEQAAVQ